MHRKLPFLEWLFKNCTAKMLFCSTDCQLLLEWREMRVKVKAAEMKAKQKERGVQKHQSAVVSKAGIITCSARICCAI